MKNEVVDAVPSNEQYRGGPRTEQGKTLAKMNATKHGLLSEQIPTHELMGYEQHVTAIREHYHPLGYLEGLLVDRIANILWRIGRVARYEQAVIKRNVESRWKRLGYDSLEQVADDINAARDYADEVLTREWLSETLQLLDDTVALASLPHEVVERIPRYEAHLDRSLKRTVTQLEKIQAQRR